MVEEFAASIREGRRPRTDGDAGLRILNILEAAGRSMAGDGELVPVAYAGAAPPDVLDDVLPAAAGRGAR